MFRTFPRGPCGWHLSPFVTVQEVSDFDHSRPLVTWGWEYGVDMFQCRVMLHGREPITNHDVDLSVI